MGVGNFIINLLWRKKLLKFFQNNLLRREKLMNDNSHKSVDKNDSSYKSVDKIFLKEFTVLTRIFINIYP